MLLFLAILRRPISLLRRSHGGASRASIYPVSAPGRRVPPLLEIVKGGVRSPGKLYPVSNLSLLAVEHKPFFMLNPANVRLLSIFLVLATSSATANTSSHPIGDLPIPQVEASYQSPYYATEYFPSEAQPESQAKIGVRYTLWVPPGLETVRGIIVHQHGCGEGSCKSSVTAAHDLHWQALARKHDCALLGPSFRQWQDQDCFLWADPQHGSDIVFLESLQKLAELSGHPEISTAPWCLWGHSGGGSWASRMHLRYPENIIAIWFQSGTAFLRDEFDVNSLADDVLQVPMMANPGVKEREHERFSAAWDGTLAMFNAYRKRGAPIGFAPDPASGHETGDSRYLAIPFFDACLDLRLPDQSSGKLKKINPGAGWLAKPLSTEMPRPASAFNGNRASAVWLPNESVARAWHDFVNTGTVSDNSPPPAPTNVIADPISGLITWEQAYDFESGIQAFLILKNGEEIGQIPESTENRFGRPAFQGMSYGDTPTRLLEYKFVDTNPNFRQDSEYQVIAINGAGLRSH